MELNVLTETDYSRKVNRLSWVFTCVLSRMHLPRPLLPVSRRPRLESPFFLRRPVGRRCLSPRGRVTDGHLVVDVPVVHGRGLARIGNDDGFVRRTRFGTQSETGRVLRDELGVLGSRRTHEDGGKTDQDECSHEIRVAEVLSDLEKKYTAIIKVAIYILVIITFHCINITFLIKQHPGEDTHH